MNKQTFTTILLMLILSAGISQGCLPDGITFSTQSGIDNFQNNYPGCTIIEGDVLISGNFINNLVGLNSIDTIRGNLKILSCHDLESLSGLDNVTFIGGYLEINSNDESLINLLGLENLTSIGGYLAILGNSELTSLSGLNNLVSIGEGLYIAFTPKLHNLNELSSVNYIKGVISILLNSKLSDISGLNNIEASSITDLKIRRNYKLSVCESESICNYLATPNGVVDIYDNDSSCNSPAEIANICGVSLPCLPFGNYYFTSQLEIDNFQFNYPGCTEMKGEVTIRGIDILDLNGLNSIRSIDSFLVIQHNDTLLNLSGLENLTSIGKGLYIMDNPFLINLTYLSNLTYVGGIIEVSRNDTLVSLDGLDNIEPESIDDLTIRYNENLSNCAIKSLCNYLISPGGNVSILGNAPGCNSSGEISAACDTITQSCLPEGIIFVSQQQINDFQTNYPGCSKIEGDVTMNLTNISNLSPLSILTAIGGSLEIANNYSLNTLSGLNNITSIEGDLIIGKYPDQGNVSLTNLEGLTNLASVGGELRIQSNQNLNSLSGLDNLEKVAGEIWIVDNNSLMSLNGLNKMDSIDALTIKWNRLEKLTGLDNVTYIRKLSLEESDYLTSVEGLESLQTIQEDLNLYKVMVKNLSGLVNLKSINGSLYIDVSPLQSINELTSLMNIGENLTINLTSISNFDAFENITELGGDLRISENSQITDFSGFENLSSVSGDVSIFSNSQLLSLNNLNNLTEIGGNLSIFGNGQLADFMSLKSLNSIGGELKIKYNYKLSSLEGLENIEPESISSLSIASNTSLSSCAVESVCDYLANPNAVVEIENNGTGCNDKNEVLAECANGVVNLNAHSQFIIYPNPAKNLITVLNKFGTSIDKVTIYNVIGQKVLQEKKNSMDVSNLGRGIYFAEISLEDLKFRYKLIIE